MVPINKEDSKWKTIAIELDDEDFRLLNNNKIWEKGIKIRQFRGWRWWRGDKTQPISSNISRSSVCDSWND